MTSLQVQTWQALRSEVAELVSALQHGNLFSAIRSNSQANQLFSMLSIANRQMVAFTMLRNVLYSVEGVVAPADITMIQIQEWDFLRIAMAMTDVFWQTQDSMQRKVLTFPLECTLFYLNNTQAYQNLQRQPLRNITNRTLTPAVL